MRLNTIHHIAIICSDKDAALDFYVNKLGFQTIPVDPDERGFRTEYE